MANYQIAAQQGYNPRKKLWKKGFAHLGVQSETGKALQEKRQKQRKIDETRQSVVSYAFNGFVFEHQYIHFEHFPQFNKLGFPVGDIIAPACVFVAHKSPIDAEHKVKQKHKRRYEMDKTHFAKPETEICLGAAHNGGRIGY